MTKRVFEFGEETGGHMELLPVEIIDQIKIVFQEFKKEDEKKDERSYTIPDFSKYLLAKNIPFEKFRNSFTKYLKPYDEVRFEISPEEIENDYFAFGDGKFSILGGLNENMEKIAWLEISLNYSVFTDNDHIYAKVLNTLGKTYSLVLIDWDKRQCVNLSMLNEVKSYLDQYIRTRN